MTPTQMRRTLHQRLLRRMHMAGWAITLRPAVEAVKRQFLQSLFGVESSTELNSTQLAIALKSINELALSTPASDVAQMSLAQRSRIIRLGKYVLGKHYGDDWFWKKLPEWTEEYNDGRKILDRHVTGRKVRKLDHLTVSEAVYVIRRLEQIEFRLARSR